MEEHHREHDERVRLDVHFHFDQPMTLVLQTSPAGSPPSPGEGLILAAINELGTILMSELSDLQAEVAKAVTIEASAIVLIQGLKAALDAAGTDPVALKKLSDSLGAEDTALAAAIVAGTPTPVPASPPPPPADQPPATLSITPTSITGHTNESVTGQFAAAGAPDGSTWAASSNSVTAVTVEPDGSFTALSDAPVTGSLNVAVAGPDGTVLATAIVSVSIS